VQQPESSDTGLIVRYEMLHDSAKGISRVLDCSTERGLLPAPREPTVARTKVRHRRNYDLRVLLWTIV